MTFPSPGRPSDLMFLLSWASHALRAEHAAGLAELGISPRAHCVLARARAGGLTQRQIGELCGVDKTTMVVTLDQLEAAGLARRVPTPTDRRARLVEVTAEGERVLGQAQEIAARLEEDVLAALPEVDREVFLRAIRRLVDERFSGTGSCGTTGSVC
ncbi:winged helix-turn-helix transcriptional regulator [Micromonospora sp. Llam7]|uniref:MarR family winged helix-turn-helix transcriptional regulator n=1 Tax=Micromonospora tarapacensis TaxID=2835305 RepID=UPI001C83953A|nr:MarR family winged helix-turn-helix transcriptional regulator [Micromonospora tarapacensis]MBX7267059.1 winged helix-turn-helix transcriptional regulator [Micromonospora tarapacensis]